MLHMLSFYLVSVEAQRPAEYRGSTKSPCKTLASTLLFGWPRGLSHERLFLARVVAGREREECKKERRQLWLSTRGGGWTHHNWWECTKSASHCVESNFAACASGICTLLAWGLSFYLKLPQQKKSHCFQTTFCGSIYCWSQQLPEEKQEHTWTGRHSDTRHVQIIAITRYTHYYHCGLFVLVDDSVNS